MAQSVWFKVNSDLLGAVNPILGGTSFISKETHFGLHLYLYSFHLDLYLCSFHLDLHLYSFHLDLYLYSFYLGVTGTGDSDL